MMTEQSTRPETLFTDFRSLLMLFISFRFLLLIVYQPLMTGNDEFGLGVGGDRAYHYALAAQVDDGLLPFRDWWSEFPPLWSIITIAAYMLPGEGVNYSSWSMLLGFLMILSETGNLVLVRKIGERLHGAKIGLSIAWVYALTVAPLVFMWWNFDSLVTFFLLLGLWLLLRKNDGQSAVVVAVGALLKFLPFLMFGAVLRFRGYRRSIIYIAISLGIFTLTYLPLFAINSELTTVSLMAQFNKRSYQTVWALMDGNYGTGNFGSIESHLYAEGVNDVAGNPPIIPNALRLLAALGIGLFIFWRTKRRDDIAAVAFVGITLLIFYLQSQGWSPQWLTQIIPLVILVFPTRLGVLITIMLSALAFGEYPFLFARTMNTAAPGYISGDLLSPWTGIILMRTLLLAGTAAAFYRLLTTHPQSHPLEGDT